MRSIKETISNEIIVQNSRFIGILYPVSSVEDTKELLTKIRLEYKDASHYCFAYLIGDHQEEQKASDDGEPQKTAGVPILEVLKKQDLTNVLAIVVRYFGGKLLGASGLIRAYSKAISSLMEYVIYTEKQDYQFLSISLDYKLHHQALPVIETYAKIINTSFLSDVKVVFQILDKNIINLQNALQEIGHQEIAFEFIKRVSLYEVTN